MKLKITKLSKTVKSYNPRNLSSAYFVPICISERQQYRVALQLNGRVMILMQIQPNTKQNAPIKLTDFYRDYPKVKQIVWIARPPTALTFAHSFAQLDHFLKYQW